MSDLREINIQQLIKQVRDYISVRDCECDALFAPATTCWKCLFEHNLRFVDADEATRTPSHNDVIAKLEKIDEAECSIKAWDLICNVIESMKGES